MRRALSSRRRAWRRPAVVGLAGLALLTAYAGLSYGSSDRPDAPLVASAADGHVDCSVDTIAELQRGQGDEADCPRLVSVLPVEDSTTGGPHWGAIDNHSLTSTGAPTRLVFSNSFVARTGVDGNHRLYMVDVDPATGALTYDQSFRNEKDGTPGVNFNRRNWPYNPDAGFYKPHAMVWVCPPGICPE